MIKKFTEYLNETDGSTTASFGSGTAINGGVSGSYTSAAGTSVSGGDSGSAFNTNSINGMGVIKSAQPSATPGAVNAKDSISGSGDIGSGLGNSGYTKAPANIKKIELEINGDKKVKEPKMNKLDAIDKAILKFSDFSSKNLKENKYIPPKMTKCKECGDEVEDTLHDMLGHVYLRHNAKPNNTLKEYEPRTMVKKYFHDVEE